MTTLITTRSDKRLNFPKIIFLKFKKKNQTKQSVVWLFLILLFISTREDQYLWILVHVSFSNILKLANELEMAGEI
ncbi:hypothetical protein BpHYR1_043020 [Brachionus plicatilis]|uniref:Uncharacterized protein n=1 Tax=Brachionus plicatilis TaxID=10195 RepID=A0A3M7RF83_BRAPC|nr:hypothetical protein BpHYR1_043020 [Brachionus plicatilis]